MERTAINYRIQRIVDELFEGNKTRFALKIGESPSTISNILSIRHTVPSSSLIIHIVENVEVSAEWLLTGEGQFEKNHHNETERQDLENRIIALESLVKQKEEQIEVLISVIKKLDFKNSPLNDVKTK